MEEHIRILEVNDGEKKSAYTREVLYKLPQWFGNKQSLEEYAEEVKEYPFYSAVDDTGKCVGFFSVKIHYQHTGDIFVCGVLPEYQHTGIGKALYRTSEEYFIKSGCKYVIVKTLSDIVDSEPYERTRRFYRSIGFDTLLTLIEMWDEKNPCLIMFKDIRLSKMNCRKEQLLLYAVTDRSWLKGETLYEQIEKALKGGVTFLQLREKTLSEEEFLKEAAEVKKLCRQYNMDFEETQRWYDGYSFSRAKSIYSPNSVVQAIKNEEFGDYWTETETYESLKFYISLNEDGLKDAVISMLGGERCRINTRTFQNDMSNIKSKDDVLTLLVHLGYLAYDSDRNEVYIPNQEVADEFKSAVEYSGWQGVSTALRKSEELLDATLQENAQEVADRIDEIHLANTSVLAYNNENALSCVITIAYYVAQKDYIMIREMPSGKGFADIAFLPRKHVDKPAMLIELKWDKSAQGAISQIREKNYAGVLDEYRGNLLLVGINYNKKDKKHECIIERYTSQKPPKEIFGRI